MMSKQEFCNSNLALNFTARDPFVTSVSADAFRSASGGKNRWAKCGYILSTLDLTLLTRLDEDEEEEEREGWIVGEKGGDVDCRLFTQGRPKNSEQSTSSTHCASLFINPITNITLY
ncbi:unnamed protein product [Tuber aestivum]|uniref:Uncharacterized protein n=1 Tax=Tuber aestivum TaxID=59557 RepID=A0A292PLP4_9PEZI|nr:unnamed protein product [Tuber aestivum]